LSEVGPLHQANRFRKRSLVASSSESNVFVFYRRRFIARAIGLLFVVQFGHFVGGANAHSADGPIVSFIPDCSPGKPVTIDVTSGEELQIAMRERISAFGFQNRRL
jgi:hypothetical protein